MKSSLALERQGADSPAPAALRRQGRPAGNGVHAIPVERILDAAFRSFAERGYEGTTLRELAKELGVSHNLLNVRFGTKRELWCRAVDARVARIAPHVFEAFDAVELDAEARLREVMLRLCRWAAENGEFVGLTYVEGRRSTWRNDYIVDAYLRPFKLRFDDLLETVAAKRAVHSISTNALMALLVQGVGFYFASAPMLDRLNAGTDVSPDETERQVAICADFLLTALLPGAA